MKNVNSPRETEKQSRIPILTKDFTLSESNLKRKKLLKFFCIENEPAFRLEKYGDSFGIRVLNNLLFLHWCTPSIFFAFVIVILSIAIPESIWVAIFDSHFYSTYYSPLLDRIPFLGIRSDALIKPNLISAYVLASFQFPIALFLGISISVMVFICLLFTRVNIVVIPQSDKVTPMNLLFTFIFFFSFCVILIFFFDPVLGLEHYGLRKRMDLPEVVTVNIIFLIFSSFFQTALIFFVSVLLNKAQIVTSES